MGHVPGRDVSWMYRKAVQLRGHTLKTKVRASRGGRSGGDLWCNGGCRKTESLMHILQECKLTQRLRIARHNRVMLKLEGSLRRAGLSVMREPYIRKDKSYVKPDLLVSGTGKIYVLDVIICNDNRLLESWNSKIRKYNTNELNDKFRQMCNVHKASVHHLPIALTMRGIMDGRSEKGLSEMGLPKTAISWLCEQTIVGSLICYDAYMNDSLARTVRR
ncbi:hypothetical protein MS3_00000651 [Schistosoma haematobium]|uniref:Retrovirus-related Pol polyprotein from type-1 retrotransposable element R2 n=1 Tax=Schistosoma haematobium TaxID=6185 RepID=A0A922IGZ3_SCHHA|nr:uncharacterized protein MS3_00000651 [Schistosoma haematobium]KAH9579076.1 hypothetical protein MS3_00000651 [Schistosoma haematobium]